MTEFFHKKYSFRNPSCFLFLREMESDANIESELLNYLNKRRNDNISFSGVLRLKVFYFSFYLFRGKIYCSGSFLKKFRKKIYQKTSCFSDIPFAAIGNYANKVALAAIVPPSGQINSDDNPEKQALLGNSNPDRKNLTLPLSSEPYSNRPSSSLYSQHTFSNYTNVTSPSHHVLHQNIITQTPNSPLNATPTVQKDFLQVPNPDAPYQPHQTNTHQMLSPNYCDNNRVTCPITYFHSHVAALQQNESYDDDMPENLTPPESPSLLDLERKVKSAIQNQILQQSLEKQAQAVKNPTFPNNHQFATTPLNSTGTHQQVTSSTLTSKKNSPDDFNPFETPPLNPHISIQQMIKQNEIRRRKEIELLIAMKKNPNHPMHRATVGPMSYLMGPNQGPEGLLELVFSNFELNFEPKT